MMPDSVDDQDSCKPTVPGRDWPTSVQPVQLAGCHVHQIPAKYSWRLRA